MWGIVRKLVLIYDVRWSAFILGISAPKQAGDVTVGGCKMKSAVPKKARGSDFIELDCPVL